MSIRGRLIGCTTAVVMWGLGAPQLAQAQAPQPTQPQPATSPYIIPIIADTSHASEQLTQVMYEFFDDKSRHYVPDVMTNFAPDPVAYMDAVLGWTFYGHAGISAILNQLFPYLPPTALSYPTRILGNKNSAIVLFTDTPEFFGAEIRVIAAVDFDQNKKVVRWIDYWDGRHFGKANTAALKLPPAYFPTSFHETLAPANNASPVMQHAVDKLADALANNDAQAAAALFSNDAIYEDFTLRTHIEGKLAIGRYLSRAVAHLPQGAGSSVSHVVGSHRGGGYEWKTAPGSAVPHGITALELDENGLITRLTTVWDGTEMADADIQALKLLSLEP